jgi:hypothetical protein
MNTVKEMKINTTYFFLAVLTTMNSCLCSKGKILNNMTKCHDRGVAVLLCFRDNLGSNLNLDNVHLFCGYLQSLQANVGVIPIIRL